MESNDIVIRRFSPETPGFAGRIDGESGIVNDAGVPYRANRLKRIFPRRNSESELIGNAIVIDVENENFSLGVFGESGQIVLVSCFDERSFWALKWNRGQSWLLRSPLSFEFRFGLGFRFCFCGCFTFRRGCFGLLSEKRNGEKEKCQRKYVDLHGPKLSGSVEVKQARTVRD